MPRFPIAAPIRLILFDAFDTLVTPRSAPHLQYAALARDHGLTVSDSDVKSAFKSAFRTTSQEHPNYGLETDIASPDEWWKLVIQRTFTPHLHSHVTHEQYVAAIEHLSNRLVARFGTNEAYHLFEDVLPALSALTEAQVPIQLGLATNSDSRILSVLASFGLDRHIPLTVSERDGPTLSYFEKSAKPDARFFQAAIRRAASSCQPLSPANVLYVGDQLHEDFWGATDADLQAAWLQRPAAGESNQPYQQIGKERNSKEEGQYVQDRTISSLSSLFQIVTLSHANPA